MISAWTENLDNRWKLLGATVLVQLVFWVIVNPTLIQPPRGGEVMPYEIVSHEIVGYSGSEDLQIKDGALVFGPDWESSLFPAGTYKFVTEFTLPSVPAEGIAMLDNSLGDNSRSYFNGSLVSARGSMDPGSPTYHGWIRKIEHVSPSMLVEGANRLEREILLDNAVKGTMPPPILMEYTAAQSAFGWPAFMLHEGRIISIVVGFILSLFLLVAMVRAEQKPMLVWLWLLSSVWAFNSLLQMWVNVPVHGPSRAFLLSGSTLVLSVMWPLFVDEWSGKPIKAFKLVVGVAGLIALAVLAWLMLVTGHDATYALHTALLENAGIGFVLLMLGRLVWHFFTQPDEDRYWEAALLVLLAVLTGWFVFSSLLYGANTPHLRLGQPLFLLAFTVAFFARNFRLFQSSAQLNALLQSQLALREEELAVAHAREKAFVRERAHEDERKRIMRDMHDGFGSSLMSILFSVREGRIEPGKLVERLEHLIDEMRLMIASMDSVGDSLDAALGTFRRRIPSRLEAAGFAFEWTNRAADDLPELGPRASLQVFRIMQEAVANALKHSGGDRISVCVDSKSDGSDGIEIRISDNGQGFKPVSKPGYGLENMQARAAQIGANVEIGTSDPSGTTVTIYIDQPAAPSEAGA